MAKDICAPPPSYKGERCPWAAGKGDRNNPSNGKNRAGCPNRVGLLKEGELKKCLGEHFQKKSKQSLPTSAKNEHKKKGSSSSLMEIKE